ANDFGEIWTSGKIGSTGGDDSGQFTLRGGTHVQVSFAPGRGTAVEGLIADTIAGASDRLFVASMAISSGKIVRAIEHGMTDVQDFGGIYDGGSMGGVEASWARAKKGKAAPKGTKENLNSFSSAQKEEMWKKLKPHLVAKHSLQYQDNA